MALLWRRNIPKTREKAPTMIPNRKPNSRTHSLAHVSEISPTFKAAWRGQIENEQPKSTIWGRGLKRRTRVGEALKMIVSSVIGFEICDVGSGRRTKAVTGCGGVPPQTCENNWRHSSTRCALLATAENIASNTMYGTQHYYDFYTITSGRLSPLPCSNYT